MIVIVRPISRSYPLGAENHESCWGRYGQPMDLIELEEVSEEQWEQLGANEPEPGAEVRRKRSSGARRSATSA